MVDLMKELEKQNFIRRYAQQDESKSRIEEQRKLLDEAEKRFDVSFADVLDAYWLTPRLVCQTNLQISVFRLQMETSQSTMRIKGALLELDSVARERHDEVLFLSGMSDKEREVRTIFCTSVKMTRNLMHAIAAAANGNTQ
jgi:DNA-binding MarR family transcriptional regulator